MLHHIARDTRYALRAFSHSRNRLLTLAIIITLTLGVASLTAVFSAVDTLLLRSLPFPRSQNLVSVTLSDPVQPSKLFGSVANLGLVRSWLTSSTDLLDVGGFQSTSATLNADAAARSIQVVGITANLFGVLGVSPAIGTGFPAAADIAGSEPITILSYDAWTELFGKSRNIIGRSVRLNGRAFRVIGVMPEAFRVPLSISENNQGAGELWIPMGSFGELMSTPDDPAIPLEVFGRLRPGVGVAAVTLRLNQISERMLRESAGAPQPSSPGSINQAPTIQVNALKDVASRSTRQPLLFLLATVCFLFVLACINVTALFMVRAVSREREFAVRVALGGTQQTLVRQVLIEILLVTSIGWGLGVLLAALILPAIAAIGAPLVPGIQSVSIDIRVVLLSLLTTLTASVLVGVWPALSAARRSPAGALHSRSLSSSKSSSRWARGLVIFELTFAILILTIMGLFGSSFLRLNDIDRGYSTEDVVIGGMILPREKYSTPALRREYVMRVLNELRSSPAIVSAAIASGAPIFGGMSAPVVDGDSPLNSAGKRMATWSVAGDYFETLGQSVLEGTAPDFEKDPSGVAVDQAAAIALFGTEDAIGRRIVWGREKSSGVVKAIVANIQDINVKGGESKKSRNFNPHIYIPSAEGMPIVIRVMGRSRGGITGSLNAMKNAVSSVDRELPFDSIDSISALIRFQLARERFLAVLVTAFALVAVIVATSGVFAVMAFVTAQRRHEIGVRMAYGASPRGIIFLVLRRALAWTFVGTTLGVVSALLFGRYLRSVLFETSLVDPILLFVIALSASMIAIVASSIPAIKAARTNPAAILKEQ